MSMVETAAIVEEVPLEAGRGEGGGGRRGRRGDEEDEEGEKEEKERKEEEGEGRRRMGGGEKGGGK